MSESATETPVLDLLSSMTAASLEASSLDAETLMLVRIAALAAVDAPPCLVSAEPRRGRRGRRRRRAGPAVRCAAIASIIGTARVASATGKIVDAIEVAIEVAESKKRRARRGGTHARPRRPSSVRGGPTARVGFF